MNQANSIRPTHIHTHTYKQTHHNLWTVIRMPNSITGVRASPVLRIMAPLIAKQAHAVLGTNEVMYKGGHSPCHIARCDDGVSNVR